MVQKGLIMALALIAAPTIGAAQDAGSKGSLAASESTGAAPKGTQRVVITPQVLEGWGFLYRFITEVEFVLCLEGRNEGGVLYIEDFRLAQMESTSENSVRYRPCRSPNYVGTAHNHPPVTVGGALCYRSIPDRQSFELDERALVDVVLCGPDRYLWVLRDGDSGGEARVAEH